MDRAMRSLMKQSTEEQADLTGTETAAASPPVPSYAIILTNNIRCYNIDTGGQAVVVSGLVKSTDPSVDLLNKSSASSHRAKQCWSRPKHFSPALVEQRCHHTTLARARCTHPRAGNVGLPCLCRCYRKQMASSTLRTINTIVILLLHTSPVAW